MFGYELERRVGSKRFLQIFFISGIIGGITYVLYSYIAGINIPAIGASGAIYGIFGTLALIAPDIRVFFFFIPYPMKLTTAIILLIIFDLLLVSGGAPIAISAHIGGLLTGLFFGYILRNELRKRYRQIYSIFEEF